MKYLRNTIYCLPLLLIIIEIALFLYPHQTEPVNPVSTKNAYLQKLIEITNSAKIVITQININDYQHEVEFIVKNSNQKTFKVVFSTDKNILYQVTALQNIIKIANIKEKEITFIDLSSQRPYATF